VATQVVNAFIGCIGFFGKFGDKMLNMDCSTFMDKLLYVIADDAESGWMWMFRNYQSNQAEAYNEANNTCFR